MFSKIKILRIAKRLAPYLFVRVYRIRSSFTVTGKSIYDVEVKKSLRWKYEHIQQFSDLQEARSFLTAHILEEKNRIDLLEFDKSTYYNSDGKTF